MPESDDKLKNEKFEILLPPQPSLSELGPEAYIGEYFPSDIIESAPTGTSGADVIQRVYNKRREFCGIIVWKFKSTKDWDDSWVKELDDYLRMVNGHVGILVSEVLPRNDWKYWNNIEGFMLGVFVDSSEMVISTAFHLRRHLIKMAAIGEFEKHDVIPIVFLSSSEVMGELWENENKKILLDLRLLGHIEESANNNEKFNAISSTSIPMSGEILKQYPHNIFMKIIGWLVFISLFVYAYFINRDIGVNIISPIFRAIFPWVGGAFLIFLIGYAIRLKLNETAPDRERERLAREEAERVAKEQYEYNRIIAKEAQMAQYQQLRKEIEAMPQYEHWRQSVFEKFGRKCAMCGSAENLEIDHRYKSLHFIIRHYGITNIAQAYECAALWDVNNGAPLCKTHHDQTASSAYHQQKTDHNG